MSEKNIPFVVNDRRKFTAEGEVREGVEIVHAPEPVAVAPEPEPIPHTGGKVVEMPLPDSAVLDDLADPAEPGLLHEPELHESALAGEDAAAGADGEEPPPAPTVEQMEQSKLAYAATAERLEMAIRATNPGADHAPQLTFETLVHSVYMQAIVQLGAGPQQGTQPQIDLLGAKQSIDMLGVLYEKTTGNLSPNEDLLLSSAVFELRLAFLEMTQALARSAQQQRGPGGPGGMPPAGGRPGPSIVR